MCDRHINCRSQLGATEWYQWRWQQVKARHLLGGVVGLLRRQIVALALEDFPEVVELEVV